MLPAPAIVLHLAGIGVQMRPAACEILEKLVAFDTVPTKSNLVLVDYARELLAGSDALTELVPNQDGSKANLIVRIGPSARGGIVLSGHTDVVSVEGQSWSSDPFRLVERDG